MSVIRAERMNDGATWDALVRSSPSGTLFHETAWLTTPTFLVVVAGGEPVAGMPDPRAVGSMGRPHIVPYGGPISFARAGALPERVRSSAQLVLAEHVRDHMPGARFCTSPWSAALDAWIPAGFRASLLYTVVVDVSDLESTRRRFSQSLRRNLGAAVRSGIEVRREPPSAELTRLISATFSRQGIGPWFDLDTAMVRLGALAQKERAAVFMARDGSGEALAGVGIVWDARRAYYLLGGRHPTLHHRGATSLALWTAMRYTRERLGLDEFDLEGSNQPTIAAFFAHFGGRCLPFFLVQYLGRNLFNE